MDLGVSGLVSGFDWRSLISQMSDVERAPQKRLRTEQSQLAQRNNAFSSIKTQLQVLQTRVDAIKDATLFTSRSASVNDATVATVSTTSGAPLGSFSLNVTQLAAAAKFNGAANIGGKLSASDDVSSLALSSAGFSTAIKPGTITVNGKTVDVLATDTLQEVFNRISEKTDGIVIGSYDSENDKIHLTSDNGSEITLGSATDTSNFLSVAKLHNNSTGEIVSSSTLGGVRTSVSLSNANLSTAASSAGGGEFKINGVTINWDSNTDSLQNVLDRINSSTAGVTASYDTINDKVVLTNKSTGDVGVAMQDVQGNFLAATGLASGSLQRGKDLVYQINGGGELRSQSNTISSESSGLTGTSITVLKQGTTDFSVTSDNSNIRKGIESFVAEYNKLQKIIDTNTASSTDAQGKVTAGILANDADAQDISSKMRSLVTAKLSGVSGALSHLSEMGIDSNGNDDNLTVTDSDKLDAALSDHLAEVQKFFTDSTSGISVKLASYLKATVGDDGTLISKQDSLTKQSTTIDTQIVDMERLVTARAATLQESFIKMEQAQSTSNQNLKYLQQKFG